MRRHRRKPNRRRWIAGALVLLLAFVVHVALDQHALFTRYHAELADRHARIHDLEAEITELEQDLTEVDTLPFIMKQALKYGMTPTDITPRIVDFSDTKAENADPVYGELR